MSTRKIKDAKDLSTNELVYLKGHAQATFMSDGRTVEEAINNIDAPDMSGYVTEDKLASALLGRQPTLVSGTNIKTINGESILGSGNVEISGGGSSGGSGKEFVEVEPLNEPLGYYGNLVTIVPNNVYVFTKPIYSLVVSSFTENNPIGDEYSIMFIASDNNIPITLTYGTYNIYWANGVVPIISSGCLCELSLMRIGNDVKAVLTTFKAV